MAQPNKQAVPTVSRVEENQIIELIYDPVRHTTAFAIGQDGACTIAPQLDLARERIVPYAASNNLIRHECVMLPSEPVPFGTREGLLADIEAYLHRYVDLSPLFERIAAHYVLLTWVFDAFNEVPYLRFQGDYGSGKTRALMVLGSVAYRGFFASGASTVSPVFHTLDRFGATLVLDEADLRYSDKTADLVKILNNGTVKGLPVLRTLQDRNKEFNPAAFSVYGPKIIAMRGTFRDEALESRFLTEAMGTRPLRSDIPIQLPDELRGEARQLRNRLLHFRLTNLSAVHSDPSRLVPMIDPRLNQTALSLLSLMDDAGLRDEVATLLRQQQAELTAIRAQAVEGRTLAAVAEIFSDPGRQMASLQEIAQRVNTGPDNMTPLTPRDVGRLLRAHAFPLRKSHGTIVVPRDTAIARLKSRAF